MRGLLNLGNTCYVNAAVQALAHVSALTARLLYPRPYDGECQLTAAYARLLSELYPQGRQGQGSEGPVDPTEFVDALRARYPQFANAEVEGIDFAENGQHDAVEVMLVMIRTLEQSLGEEFIANIFVGKMRQTTSAPGVSSTITDPFGFLPLDVNEPATLAELVAEYLAPHTVEGFRNSEGECVRARTVLEVVEWPRTVVFTFNVFSYHFLVTLPLEFEGRRLVAVVLQHGSASSGHYGAAVRVKDQWWLKNDSSCEMFESNTAGCLVAKAYAAVYRGK